MLPAWEGEAVHAIPSHNVHFSPTARGHEQQRPIMRGSDEESGWRDNMKSKGLRGVFGEGNGTPLQYSFLENPMDGGAW